MSSVCPRCQTISEPNARFCMECGGELTPSKAPENGPQVVPLGLSSSSTGSELLVEVETNRQYLVNHASILRFRVTSNLQAACGVTIRMRLHGQGHLVEQDEGEVEQRCQVEHWGQQYVFSFPFIGLKPGDIPVRELRVMVARPDRPGKIVCFDLPDQSLFVHVGDPSAAAQAPGIVISGGINLSISDVGEMYGSDMKNLISLNAQHAVQAGAAIEWQPIRLRFVEEVAVRPKDVLSAELRLSLPSGVTLDLLRIRAGEFVMGSPEGQGKDDERPAHPVRITRDFYLGKYPLTQDQYAAVMEQNPSRFPISPKHPVDNVSWEDAQEFCRRLRSYLVTTPGAIADTGLKVVEVSLPTEAQWEYACRAGTATAYPFGDDRLQLLEYGWSEKNAKGSTHPVGQLRPNPWGLYDMLGNVWEWCRDYYQAGYSPQPEEDPAGPSSGCRRVLRGGSWSCYARDCRSASRRSVAPDERTANYGFRVALFVAAPSAG